MLTDRDWNVLCRVSCSAWLGGGAHPLRRVEASENKHRQEEGGLDEIETRAE